VSVDKTGAYYGQVEAKIWACFVLDGEEVESAAGNEQMSGR
jgi:threonine/homoserine efflux transporter RhtA